MSHYPAVAAPGDNWTVSLRRLLQHDSRPACRPELVLLFCFTSLSGIQETVAIHAAGVTDLDVPLLVIRQQSMSARIAQPKG